MSAQVTTKIRLSRSPNYVEPGTSARSSGEYFAGFFVTYRSLPDSRHPTWGTCPESSGHLKSAAQAPSIPLAVADNREAIRRRRLEDYLRQAASRLGDGDAEGG
jgi:hypothetical protein